MGAAAATKFIRCGAATVVDTATAIPKVRFTPPVTGYDQVAFEVNLVAGTTLTISPGYVKDDDVASEPTIDSTRVMVDKSQEKSLAANGRAMVIFHAWAGHRMIPFVTAIGGSGNAQFAYSMGRTGR